jgi:hypothetical protein
MTKDERTEKRAAILQDFHGSGLTQKAYCEASGIALSTLQYWLGRERKKSWAQSATDVVPVGTVQSATGNRMLRVVATGGVLIEIERPVSESELAMILKAISTS